MWLDCLIVFKLYAFRTGCATYSVDQIAGVHQVISQVHASVIQMIQCHIQFVSMPDLRQVLSEQLQASDGSIELQLGFNAWFGVSFGGHVFIISDLIQLRN